MSNLLKRVISLEEKRQELQEGQYLAAIGICSEADLEKYKGKIGAKTTVIKIVPATKRVGFEELQSNG